VSFAGLVFFQRHATGGGADLRQGVAGRGADLQQQVDAGAVCHHRLPVAAAHQLINYLLDPRVAARNTNFVSYANGDLPSQFIDKSIRDDPTIYPDAATMAKFYTIIAHDQKTQRLINRLWTRIKTGE